MFPVRTSVHPFLTLAALGSALGACLPLDETEELPPLVAQLTSGLELDPAAKPITVLWGQDCANNRGIVAMPPERYARLCAACEVNLATGTNPRLTYQVQKVLCLTYGEHHRGDNFWKKKRLKRSDGGYCADVTGSPDEKTGVSTYTAVAECNSGGTCFCNGKHPRPVSNYFNADMDRLLADTYGQVLAPKSQGKCDSTVETEFDRRGGHGRGWVQGETYGANTWQDVLARVPYPTYRELAPCALPYAAQALARNPGGETPPDRETASARDGSGSASEPRQAAGLPAPAKPPSGASQAFEPYEPSRTVYSSSPLDQASCTVCQSDQGCGCWETRLEGETAEGYCDVRGPCEEQLGSYYSYFFGSTPPLKRSSTSTSSSSGSTPRRSSSSSSSDDDWPSSSSSKARASRPPRSSASEDASSLEGCTAQEVCNGADDDCDAATIDGSGDPRLYEPCELPELPEEEIPEAARLVSAPDGRQGALVCRQGELVCADEAGRSEFEQIVEASREAADASSDDDEASGCPALASMPRARPRGLSWIVVFALIAALRKRRAYSTGRGLRAS